ncbi:hypothetical protein F4779DRAFT_350331 [Xylariaceae sp. FL0662B]|nr:hypothetical protein F4779DRAFT_350331 [Xylariaceae sp. FL0662B]
MGRLIWRSAVGLPATVRPVIFQTAYINRQHFFRHASSLPTIVQPSFWKSLIPKPFRREEQPVEWRTPKQPKSKEWNPATFFIVIFLFIGSMSIQMIALRNEFNTFMRRADVRIGLLREVVEKLQRGEEVDVEKALGTGDAEREKEWEEVLREIDRDDVLKNTKKDKAKQPPSNTEPKAKESPESTELPKAKAAGYSSFF